MDTTASTGVTTTDATVATTTPVESAATAAAPAAPPAPAVAAASDAGGAAAAAGAGSAGGAAAGSAADVPAAPPAYASKSGVVLFAGSASHSLTGRGGPTAAYDGVPETLLWRFHVFGPLRSVKVKAVFASGTACHYAAVSEDGGLYVWGRNERGQCGSGDLKNVYAPTRAAGLPPIASVAIGRAFTLALGAGGTLHACGDGSKGQLGLGKAPEAPQTTWAKSGAGVPAGDAIVGAAAGGEFSLVVTASGRVFACGSSEAGQLGSGTTGERIVQAGKVSFDVEPAFKQVTGGSLESEKVTAVAAGAAHGVALTAVGQVFTWGSGSYGRLGHNGAKDELRPRRVAVFEQPRMRVATIAAGATSTFFVSANGQQAYFCGQTKKTGEATMYPKPLYDLSGWKPFTVSSGNTSSAVAAEGGLITWGGSPTYGELGYGEATKSSTKPQLVDDLAGARVFAAASGYGATLCLLDADAPGAEGEMARKLLTPGNARSLKVYEPPAASAVGGGGSGGGGAAGGAAGGGKRKGAAGDDGGAGGGAKKGKKAK